jgi:hypothetical protein
MLKSRYVVVENLHAGKIANYLQHGRITTTWWILPFSGVNVNIIGQNIVCILGSGTNGWGSAGHRLHDELD